jgi:amino acid adenylation domain-containing protein
MNAVTAPRRFALTPLQQQLWALAQTGPAGSLAYNISLNLRLRGPLRRDLLREAIGQVWERHEAMRTTIARDGSEQVVVDGLKPDAKLVDLGRVPAGERDAALQQQIALNNAQPFDFEQGPLFRVRIYRLGEQEHLLMLTAHHIVSDGWSLSLVLQEIVELYAAAYGGGVAELAAPMQFERFIALEDAREAAGGSRPSEAYWLQQLTAPLPLTDLPLERQRPRLRSFRAGRASLRLDGDYRLRLRRLAGKSESTLFMLLFSAFALLLHRVCRQREILLGTPSAGRFFDGSDTLVGYCGSLLPVRCRYDGELAFADYLRAMRKHLLQAYDHQEFSFAKLIGQLPLERTTNRAALIDAIFNLELPVPLPAVPGLTLQVETQATPYSSYDLFFNVAEIDGALSLDLDYNEDVLGASSAQTLLQSFKAILDHALDAPATPLAQIDLLGAAQQTLRAQRNATQAPLPAAQTLHAQIEANARDHADATALVVDGMHVSYAALNRRANQLAHALIARGVQPEDRIGLCVDRSLDLFVALLGIFKAGACYVPLDPEYPRERLQFSAEHSGIALLLTQQACRGLVEIAAERQLLLDDPATYEGQSPLDPPARGGSANLAYIIYTSGSTGRPKGVAVTHGSVLNLMRAMQEKPGFTRSDRLLGITTFAFDMSVVELYLPLCTGAALVVARRGSVFDGRQFYAQVQEQHVDVLQATPAAWRLLLGSSWKAPLPVRMLCGGEALTEELDTQLAGQGSALWNMYGPTETTVWSSCFLSTPGATAASASGNRPVGQPLANTTFHILDAAFQPVPDGVPGTLYIGGAGLARGYWGRADLTAERFIPDPFSAEPGARLYDTGDLARFLASGDVDFIGRSDNQVKVRGFRIELGEIEAALERHPAVRQAAVIAVRDKRGDNKLLGFVETAEEIDRAEIRQHLKQSLPHYMVPAVLTRLARLPLGPTGKIDRKALATLQAAGAESESVHVAPRTPLEARLCAEWAEVLGVARVGIGDDFFALGGHSLLAAQLVTRLRERLGLQASLAGLMASPTIEGLVNQLGARRDDGIIDEEGLPQIVPDPAARQQPFPLTAIQEAYWIGRSASFELGNTPAFNYTETRIEDVDPAAFERAWNLLLRRHDMLRMRIDEDGRQCVAPYAEPQTLACADFSALDEAAQQTALAGVRAQMTGRDAADHTWSELRLSRVSARVCVVHLYLDMMVFDGASLHILYRELAALVLDPAAPLPPLSLNFRDYVLAERALTATPAFDAARDYWLRRIDTLPGAPDLPLACAPASIARPVFGRRCGDVAAVHWQAAKAIAQRHGITPSTLALTAFSEVVGTWARQPRFTINLTLFNRLGLHAQVNEVIGDFTSLSLLAIDRSAQAGFVDRARANQHQLWSDLEHRAFGGVQVIRELHKRRGGPAASMPVVFTSDLSIAQHAPRSALERQLSDQRVGISHTPQIWLDVAVMENDGALTVLMDAVEQLFPAGVLDAMFAAYTELLERLAMDESAWRSRQIVALPPSQSAVRERVNATQVPWSGRLLQQGFEEQAQRTPEALAVWSSAQCLSYRELRTLARHYAHQLRAAGLKPNQLVGVVMHKGWEQVVATLAVLHAGGAYLPIDAALPEARIGKLLQAGDAALVLTQAGVDAALAWPAGALRWVVDAQALQRTELPALEAVQELDNLAYVIFTSGSTGEPKGVMIDHRGAMNTCESINALYRVTAADRVLALSSLSFDLSVYDVFGVLAAGGGIVVPDAALEKDPAHWSDLVDRTGVSLWNTVPALLQLFVEHHEQQQRELPSTLREVMLSGDWIPVGLPDRLRALAPQVQVTSMGGATEASIWSIYYPIGEVGKDWRSIPYGRPLANQSYHVLKNDLSDCPDHVVGDLYIGGIGLAQGYWRDPIRTATSFVFHPRTGERLYRTGDMGRYFADGDIEFLGREDSQVKIQGYRVELGEIEAALLRQPGVSEAVVVAQGEAGKPRRLVGYAVLEEAAAATPEDGRAAAALERTLFKLGRPGLRRFETEPASVVLAGTDELALTWEAATTPATQLELAALGNWLSALRGRTVEGSPLPKFHYPSSGSLNPIQTYLEIGEAAIAGLDAGSYYYDPQGHRLQRIGTTSAAQGQARLHLVAALEAVTPLYGDGGVTLCEVEAGYVAETLRLAAPVCGVLLQEGAAALDGAAPETIAAQLNLAPTQVLQASYALRGCTTVAASQRLGVLERQSYRRYTARPLQRREFDGLLAGLQHDADLDWYLHVKPQGVETLEPGYYRYRPQTRTLELITATAELPARRYGGGSAATFAQAAVAVYALGEATRAARAAAGAQGQRLSVAGLAAGIGVCPIGGFNEAGLAGQLGVDATATVLHSFLAGAIEPEQRLRWEQEAAPSATPVVERLRAGLAEVLPAYMVPSALVVLDRLPLSSNGKVDRKALPAPQEQAGPRLPAEPTSELQARILAIWTEVLGLEGLGIHDHFFESGGDSLKVVQVQTRLRAQLKAEVSLRELYENPSIAALDAVIAPRLAALPTASAGSTIKAAAQRERRREQLARLSDEDLRRLLVQRRATENADEQR